jgi:hypothetical protein
VRDEGSYKALKSLKNRGLEIVGGELSLLFLLRG